MTPNTQMIAITRSKYLKISSAKDAMSLLLTSERVYAEMIDWLQYGEPEQLCLRLWEEELSLDYEFRLFIHQGNLTAITQNDHYTYYPYLFPQKRMLQDGLYHYWQEIHPFVNDPDSSYVLDVAYLPTSNKFMMVEISPFSPCTGPALFHWEHDRVVLEGRSLLPAVTDHTVAIVPDQSEEAGGGGEEETDKAWTKVVFRLKEEKDLHPHLADLIEINWFHRWTVNASTELLTRPTVYDAYYTTTQEDIDEANAAEAKAAAAEAAGTTNVFRRLLASMLSLFTTQDTLSITSETAAKEQEQVQKEQKKDNDKEEEEETIWHTLFVYGTLKQHFHWNTKYMHPRLGARYLYTATTCAPMALVMGDSGVPYLLGDLMTSTSLSTTENSSEEGLLEAAPISEDCWTRRQCILGEVWEVSTACLQGLDEYEGISKSYYRRVMIDVEAVNSSNTKQEEVEETSEKKNRRRANVYILTHSSPELRQREYLSEYTYALHEQYYKPIKHIQVKQINYYKTPSQWGKTKILMDAMIEKVNH